MGVSFHYQNNDAWVPAKMTAFGDEVSVWDVTDSDKGKLYMADSIDECQFYVVNNDAAHAKYLKPGTGKKEFNNFFGKK